MDPKPSGIRLGEKLQLRTARNVRPKTETEGNVPTLGATDLPDICTRKLKALKRRNSAPVTSISRFMALVAELNAPFKPMTLYRPWSISAGCGATASVEVHRYVPGRNFDLFNDVSPIKLRAYKPDARRTGEYYAVKRLRKISSTNEVSSSRESANQFDQLATELRILAHQDLHGHPNLVYLFGVSYSPIHDQTGSAEPNLVLQEGDCGDLFNFCRTSDLSASLHTLVEVKMSLCFDVVCGLEALHKHGVAHTDLKPQNILIRRRQGRDTNIKSTRNAAEAAQVAIQAISGHSPFVAMLTDFGGSSIFSDSQDGKIKRRMYTPLWCAPEIYSNQNLSKSDLIRADIYSAGLVVAFILLEGRDVFTTEVRHGMLHAEDTTLSHDEVKRAKMGDMVISMAEEAVASFETSFFGIRADGERIYFSRDIMYQPPHLLVFNAILAACLSSDPSRRVSNALDIMSPWKTALQSRFHLENDIDYQHPELFQSYYGAIPDCHEHYKNPKTCVRPDGKCQAVPAAFANSRINARSGVFDIQQNFSIFGVSLTSGLKTEIFADLWKEASLVESITKNLASSSQLTEFIPMDILSRAAESAHQVAVAYLQGFGTAVSNSAALGWIRLAAEWGNRQAMAAYLPISQVVGAPVQLKILPLHKTTINHPLDKAYKFASQAIITSEDLATASLLSKMPQQKCLTAIEDYRKRRALRIWTEFQNYSKLNKHMFDECQNSVKDYFRSFQIDYRLPVGSGWTILHYAAYAGNVSAVQRLIQYWGGDVRILSAAGETALDIAIEAGHDELVEYLLSEHEKLDPSFVSSSCPLMNCSSLPVNSIGRTILRILKMNKPPGVDSRNAATGRTALLNTFLNNTPVDPAARDRAIEALLLAGANPLLTTPEPGKGSSLMFAVLELRYDLVQAMLEKIRSYRHTLVFANTRNARPEPENELARSFFFLMKRISQSHKLMLGVKPRDSMYSKLIALLTEETVAKEVPYVCGSKIHNPLSLACYYGNAEAARLIVEHRATAGLSVRNYTDGEGSMKGLHVAIDAGYVDVLDVLFPLMMDRFDIADWNVLSSAIHHQPDLVPKIFSFYEARGKGRKLLEYCDPWGASALDTALEYGYLEIAKFLVEKGATYDEYRLKGDHSIDDGKQSTLASVIPHMNKIKFLMELDPAPRLIVTESQFNVFHVLAADAQLIGVTVGSTEFDNVMNYFHNLDSSLIHSRAGEQGMTPFHVVSLHYSEVVGSFLHRNGADINATDLHGYTPLDYLNFHAKGDQVPSGQQLVINYVSPNSAQRGHTICDYALAGPAYWHLETRLLRDCKAQYQKWGAKTGEEVREARAAARAARAARLSSSSSSKVSIFSVRHGLAWRQSDLPSLSGLAPSFRQLNLSGSGVESRPAASMTVPSTTVPSTPVSSISAPSTSVPSSRQGFQRNSIGKFGRAVPLRRMPDV